MSSADGQEQIRIDKWLWRARFFKSRSQASVVCSAGRVRIDGVSIAKAHATVRPGQVLTFVKDRHVRVIKVLAIPVRRGPASEAQACYEDLSPPEVATRLPGAGPSGPVTPSTGGIMDRNHLGRIGKRPTKKDRRQMESVVDDRHLRDGGDGAQLPRDGD